jgi:hypothetical protein
MFVAPENSSGSKKIMGAVAEEKSALAAVELQVAEESAN